MSSFIQLAGAMKLTNSFATIGRELGLGLSQCLILDVLNRRGTQRTTDVAKALGYTVPRITMATREMKQRGYIDMEPAYRDRRAYYLFITDEGKDALRSMEGAFHA